MANQKGVVAAGHPVSVEAGIQVLEAGGNAADAAVATAFAATVAEVPLTSLAAGGFALVHEADSSKQTLLDFFVDMPGKDLPPNHKTADLVPAPVDFGEAVQMFHAGHSAVGVPGFVHGVLTMHERFGKMPLKELFEPAKQAAKEGVAVNEQLAYVYEILAGILGLTPESKRLFFNGDKTLQVGEKFINPEMVDTLDIIAAEGKTVFYQGEIAEKAVREVQSNGGLLTQQDFEEYETVERKPVSRRYRDYTVVSNPPPSTGGALLIHSLGMLSDFDVRRFGWQSAEHVRHLVEALGATAEMRKVRFDDHIHEEDILDRLLAEEMIRTDRERLRGRLGKNTTHISVMDGDGNAVSLTSSNGEGAGIMIPGTGILLNNMLGEEYLNPGGFHSAPVGQRLTSMQSPSMLLEDEECRVAVGSAGTSRIPSIVLQVLSAIADFGMTVEQAVTEPRISFDDDKIELEGGIDPEVAAKLTADGYNVSLWKDRNLFFGGLQAVARDPKTGELSGAGDPRRGGTAKVI